MRCIEKSDESIKEAIIILEVKDNFEGIAAEYEYLEKKFGKHKNNIDITSFLAYLRDNRDG